MSKVRPFRYYCQKVLPLVYDDSLSYYELLSKLVAKINEVIGTNEEVEKLITTLKEYVDSYFDNLDVQEEVNNKLDKMAEDGTLAEIIDESVLGEVQEKVNKIYGNYCTPDMFKTDANTYTDAFRSMIEYAKTNNVKVGIPKKEYALTEPFTISKDMLLFDSGIYSGYTVYTDNEIAPNRFNRKIGKNSLDGCQGICEVGDYIYVALVSNNENVVLAKYNKDFSQKISEIDTGFLFNQVHASSGAYLVSSGVMYWASPDGNGELLRVSESGSAAIVSISGIAEHIYCVSADNANDLLILTTSTHIYYCNNSLAIVKTETIPALSTVNPNSALYTSVQSSCFYNNTLYFLYSVFNTESTSMSGYNIYAYNGSEFRLVLSRDYDETANSEAEGLIVNSEGVYVVGSTTHCDSDASSSLVVDYPSNDISSEVSQMPTNIYCDLSSTSNGLGLTSEDPVNNLTYAFYLALKYKYNVHIANANYNGAFVIYNYNGVITFDTDCTIALTLNDCSVEVRGGNHTITINSTWWMSHSRVNFTGCTFVVNTEFAVSASNGCVITIEDLNVSSTNNTSNQFINLHVNAICYIRGTTNTAGLKYLGRLYWGGVLFLLGGNASEWQRSGNNILFTQNQ